MIRYTCTSTTQNVAYKAYARNKLVRQRNGTRQPSRSLRTQHRTKHAGPQQASSPAIDRQ
eukprot:6200198-Pleurochrysis_carterae.AAC.1